MARVSNGVTGLKYTGKKGGAGGGERGRGRGNFQVTCSRCGEEDDDEGGGGGERGTLRDARVDRDWRSNTIVFSCPNFRVRATRTIFFDLFVEVVDVDGGARWKVSHDGGRAYGTLKDLCRRRRTKKDDACFRVAQHAVRRCGRGGKERNRWSQLRGMLRRSGYKYLDDL